VIEGEGEPVSGAENIEGKDRFIGRENMVQNGFVDSIIIEDGRQGVTGGDFPAGDKVFVFRQFALFPAIPIDGIGDRWGVLERGIVSGGCMSGEEIVAWNGFAGGNKRLQKQQGQGRDQKHGQQKPPALATLPHSPFFPAKARDCVHKAPFRPVTFRGMPFQYSKKGTSANINCGNMQENRSVVFLRGA